MKLQKDKVTSVRIPSIFEGILKDYKITVQEFFDRAVNDYFKIEVRPKGKNLISFNAKKWNEE